MKKTTVTCDCCGKEVERWLEIYVTPNTKESYMNVSDLMQYNTAFQVCKECCQWLIEHLKEAER